MNERRASTVHGFFGRCDRGAAAVEFAMVLPILTVLLFGLIEAGRMFWTYQSASASVREAARYAARVPVTCTSVGAGAFVNGTATITNLATNGVLTGGSPRIPNFTATAAVECKARTVTPSGGSGSVTLAGRYESSPSAPTVKVTGTVTYPWLAGKMFNWADFTFTVSNEQPWTE